MIGIVYNSMMSVLMAKFMMNDVPHALGVLPPGTATGTPIIIGTEEQRQAVQSLISRCAKDIPEGALSGFTIQFGIPERLFHPGEKPEALYNTTLKTAYLPQNATEYDFYHELCHYLDDVAGYGIARHAEADRFARKWGISRKKVTGAS